MSTMVDTSQLSGTKDMDMAGVFAAAAKNRRQMLLGTARGSACSE